MSNPTLFPLDEAPKPKKIPALPKVEAQNIAFSADPTEENDDPKTWQSSEPTNFSYLDDLNDVQRAAVENTQGASMIIAGPGAGKTRVLTYRIAHLINTGVPPYRILALTFTNKAASEMKERIREIAGEAAAQRLWMGTFHSIFAKLLRFDGRQLGYPSNFSIYDTQDSKNLLNNIIKEKNLNKETYKPGVVQNRISNAKNNLVSPLAYQENLQFKLKDEAAGVSRVDDIYKTYNQRCQRAGAMDFDDLLWNMYRLLQLPEVAAKYQDKFQYILIDEFQDTNMVQYAIVKKLAEKYKNISVVGDDAQSIYAFRGATIQNILNFSKDYKDLKIFKLEQNYRSTKKIVAIANSIIQNNKHQIAKQIWTANEDGNKIKLISASNEMDEAKKVVGLLHEERLRNHFHNQDFAILYRTNAQSRPFEEALRRQNIPYRVYGGLSFFQRKEVKDFMAYMRVTANPKDEEALRRVINYPKRGIGKVTMEKISKTANDMEVSIYEILININQFNLGARVRQGILKFTQLITSFQSQLANQNAYEVANYIGRLSGLVKELNDDKSIEGISRYENVQELLNSVKEFVDNKNREKLTKQQGTVDSSLGAYLQEVSLLTDMDKDEGDDNNKVKLMTIHAAKGLEFPYVYIVGLEEKLFPSARSLNSPADIEEERRLFYVAATRAKKKLALSFASCRYKFGQIQYCQPSRFVEEIAADQLQVIGNSASRAFSSSAFDSFKKGEVDYQKNRRSNIKNVQQSRSFARNQGLSPEQMANFKPSKPTEIQQGQTILHQRFGQGNVTNLEGRGDKTMATIHFENGDEKRILIRYAKLQILN